MKTKTKNTKVLIILDGWGQRTTATDNAIAHAQTPVWDNLLQQCPHTLVNTSGTHVGLPAGQMGNSEVGHLNIGAGRQVYQNYTRISKAIANGKLFTNVNLIKAMDNCQSGGGSLHICGLLSPGGVHSHQDHVMALCRMAHQRGVTKLCLHIWLDGRDTPPRSAQGAISALEQQLQTLNLGRIVSIAGRYYAMDRDYRWERTKAAYDAMRHGKAEYQIPSAQIALQQAYTRGEDDEFITPTVITDATGCSHNITTGDSVICANFRPDRSRQITRAFVEPLFKGFALSAPLRLGHYVMMTEYAASLNATCAFPPQPIINDLGEVMAKQGKTQLRIAETEKYAHVTFFFSGGQEECYSGEIRELIASPNVATYDLKPEMSAPKVTERLVTAIQSEAYDLIVCNFANPDMVGHTGNFAAAIKAVEAVDQALGQITVALATVDAEALITADHGNVELMFDPENNQPHTAHTTYPVPLVYFSSRSHLASIKPGILADIAPTLLTLMALPIPEQMTGQSLVQFN
jgi:2,3-bisphosphoglycerate-independent phosphoglycerate mutase